MWRPMRIVAVAAAACLATPGSAYTDCPPSHVSKVLAVDAGSVAIWFTSGTVGYHAFGGGSAQTILALATTASVTGRTVSARYAADGLDCSVGGFRSDLIGLYLNA